MGICKLCEKLGELLEKQLIGEFALPAGRGSVEAHNRYGQVPAGYMKLIGYSWKPAVHAKYNTWKPAVHAKYNTWKPAVYAKYNTWKPAVHAKYNTWKPAVYAKYNTWKPAVQKPAAALNQLCRSATLQITTYLH